MPKVNSTSKGSRNLWGFPLLLAGKFRKTKATANVTWIGYKIIGCKYPTKTANIWKIDQATATRDEGFRNIL